MNKKFLTSIVLSTISCFLGCNTIIKTNINKDYSSFEKLDVDIMNETLDCKKESTQEKNSFSTKSNNETKIEGVYNPKEFKISPDDEPRFKRNSFPSNNSSNNVILPELLDTRVISITFKDEYKVRLKKEIKENESENDTKNEKEIKENDSKDIKEVNDSKNEKENSKQSKIEYKFYSLNNENLEELEGDLEESKIDHIASPGDMISDAEILEAERILKEGIPDYKPSTIKSLFYIKMKDTISFEKVKKTIIKLRNLPFVKEVNPVYSGTTSADPIVYTANTTDAIFTNPSSLFDTNSASSSFNPQTQRYWYPRIEAYKAWEYLGSIGNSGINGNFNNRVTSTPVKVAVIDFDGFITNRSEDKINYDTANQMEVYEDPSNAGTYLTKIGATANVLPNKNANGKWLVHGEECAAILGAPNDLKGIVGTANIGTNSSVSVLPIRVKSNGSLGVAKALNEIYTSPNNYGVKVVSISLNFGFEDRLPADAFEEMRTFINLLALKGIITFISAGNKNFNISNSYTKSLAMTVASTEIDTNTKATFSNYGSVIDISAPGKKIATHTLLNTSNSTDSNYDLLEGTSLSTPMIAGVSAALMGLSNRSDLRNGTLDSILKIKNIIFNSGTPILSEYSLGLRKNSGVNTISPDYFSPNGTMLNMYKALKLSAEMDPNKNYVRLFNTDYHSKVGTTRTCTDPNDFTTCSPQNLLSEAFYKEDTWAEIPSNINTLYFGTSNKSCIYSWGYQIWNKGVVQVERVQGIAGKFKPMRYNTNFVFSNNVISSQESNEVWINEGNSGIGWTSPSQTLYLGADIVFSNLQNILTR